MYHCITLSLAEDIDMREGHQSSEYFSLIPVSWCPLSDARKYSVKLWCDTQFYHDKGESEYEMRDLSHYVDVAERKIPV